LNVPVGLIHDDYGGTPAQAWTSRDALEAVPILKHYVVEEAAYPSQYPALLDAYNTKKAVFLQAKAKYDIDAAAAKAAGTPAPTPPPSAPYSVPPYEKWPAGAAHLYNGMVAPVIPYGIRGVIWYQGESNNGRGYEYKTLFPTLINDWRKNWGQGAFPFLFVQLAPTYTIHPPYENYSWVDVREAQRLTLSVEPNTAMVVTTDIGDSTTVHPTRKEPVGHRLALAARALVYGEPLEYTGPMLGAVSIEGAKISVSFTHADGLHSIAVHDAADDGTLVAPADRLAGFEIAGSDHKYHAADAVILGSSVIVSSPDVPAPVAVRYGWANYPIANLSNNAGLPASPFKTDEWRWASQPTDK